MSTKNKKSGSTGVRYSDAQKQEVIKFIADYNSKNGRGGQSAASKKFGITQLTLGSWLKKAGVKKAPKADKAPKAAKAAKAPKAAKKGKAAGASSKGRRYSAEEKKAVIDFVNEWNAKNGRGGQSQAAKKFNLSVLTVSSWLKGAGVKTPKKGAVKAAKAAKVAVVKTAAAPSALGSKVSSLLQVSDQIRKAESELQQLRAKYDSLAAAVRASL